MSVSDIPVLLLIHRRPDTTAVVIDALREVQPSCIFISGDGPIVGDKSDEARVRATREVLTMIDWPCEVSTNLADSNLGLKVAVSSGISWFFEHVDEGVILEDDCIPTNDFFHFVGMALNRFRDDTRIMSISGNNITGNRPADGSSYYFSAYCGVWGWATWKRAWKLMDLDMNDLESFINRKGLKDCFNSKYSRKFWGTKLRGATTTNRSWAFPWNYSHFINHGLCVTPSVNLVSNIGFGNLSTNAIDAGSRFADLPTDLLGEIRHPIQVSRNAKLDEAATTMIAKEQLPRWPRLRSLGTRIKRKIC